MTRAIEQLFVWCLLLTFIAVASNAKAADAKGNGSKPVLASGADAGEARLIAGLAADDPRKVLNALDDLAEQPNPGTNAIAAARKLLSDPRPALRKKAARALGAIHAQVDQADLKAIYRMLKSYDKAEADEALKALRGLHAPEAVPEITPLLKSSHNLLVRDACRTLAVLGTKELIPAIEPLLKHPNADVRTDAQSAITALQKRN